MRSDSKAYKLLEKSKDSALLAVEIYNKPRTEFRTGGFVVMMHIAWTSLFHAIFERENIMYYYKKNSIHYETIDGDYKAWELSTCLKKYNSTIKDPVEKNLQFLIKLRNKIEHRFAPLLDQDVFGECQANLINYEQLLEKEFGEKHIINENLVFSLQFSNILHKKQQKSIKVKQTNDYKELKTFVDSYRSKLDKSTLNSMNYNFKVYLLPKVGNHEKSSDFTLEFILYDITNEEEMEKYQKFLVAIKENRVIVDGLTPSEVANAVYEALKDKMPKDWMFNASSHHAKCWQYYKIRPSTNSKTPENTKSQYCKYFKPYKQYIYTEQWKNFLIKKLKDSTKYRKILES